MQVGTWLLTSGETTHREKKKELFTSLCHHYAKLDALCSSFIHSRQQGESYACSAAIRVLQFVSQSATVFDLRHLLYGITALYIRTITCGCKLPQVLYLCVSAHLVSNILCFGHERMRFAVAAEKSYPTCLMANTFKSPTPFVL